MEFLTVKDISKILSVSRWKVYQLLESGDLEGLRIGRQWRIEIKNLTSYVDPEGKFEDLRNSLDKAYDKRCPHAHASEVYDPKRMKHFDGPDLCEINGKFCILSEVYGETCIIWEEIKKQMASEDKEAAAEIEQEQVVVEEEQVVTKEQIVVEEKQIATEEKLTTVVNLKTTPGFNINNPDDIYIGRFHQSIQHGILPKSKWYNPYKIGKILFGTNVTREEALALYKDYILRDSSLMEALPELKGKRLGCWCKSLSCHGDILAELANNLKGEGS